MSDPRLVDMEPGGESTQYAITNLQQMTPADEILSSRYESIRLYTKSPAKQTGQLGGIFVRSQDVGGLDD